MMYHVACCNSDLWAEANGENVMGIASSHQRPPVAQGESEAFHWKHFRATGDRDPGIAIGGQFVLLSPVVSKVEAFPHVPRKR